jgi:hypothetical protein
MRSEIAKRIINNTPRRVAERVRKYANSLVKNKEKETACKNCNCQDLEDWFNCQDKK